MLLQFPIAWKHAMPIGVAELESAQGNYSLMPDLMDSELINVYFQ